MEMVAAEFGLQQSSGFCCQQFLRVPRTSWSRNFTLPGPSRSFLRQSSLSMCPSAQFSFRHVSSLNGGFVPKRKGIHVMSPDLASPGLAVEFLDAWDDEYNGVIIDAECLPPSANAFASALRSSLTNWKLKGKRGIWLKILPEQADLVPIAIQEGFDYHHAEPGYVMLTYCIPNEPYRLPGGPSHQIGLAGFVINDRQEVLVVKEKGPCSCFGVDTVFQEMVAFRHAHRVAFEKSDLLFACVLKPLSSEITVDEKEIQDAKWMPIGEVMEQPFYQEDHMSGKMIEICTAAHEDRYNGYQNLMEDLLTFITKGQTKISYY